jgi:hypothetical protein
MAGFDKSLDNAGLSKICEVAQSVTESFYFSQPGSTLFAHGDVLLPTLYAVKGFGQVVTASVTMDTTTLKSKGFGFVQFKTEDGMKKAIEALNGKKVYYSNFGL